MVNFPPVEGPADIAEQGRQGGDQAAVGHRDGIITQSSWVAIREATSSIPQSDSSV